MVDLSTPSSVNPFRPLFVAGCFLYIIFVVVLVCEASHLGVWSLS